MVKQCLSPLVIFLAVFTSAVPTGAEECQGHHCPVEKMLDRSGYVSPPTDKLVTRASTENTEDVSLPIEFNRSGLSDFAPGGQFRPPHNLTFSAGLGQRAWKYARYSITNLEPAYKRLTQGGSIAYEKTMRDYAKLMANLADGSAENPPTPEVHLVWISHLLRSAHYRESSENAFGCIIDHDLAAIESASSWDAFKVLQGCSSENSAFLSPKGKGEGEDQFYQAVTTLLSMDIIKGDVEFFDHLTHSFRTEMSLPAFGKWLSDPSATESLSENLTQLDKVLERQYYMHLLVDSRLKACSQRSMNPVFHVDWLWHTHVISPKKHRKDCIEAFGTEIDHTPGPILENSRPIWRILFGGSPADEIKQLLTNFVELPKKQITVFSRWANIPEVVLEVVGTESAKDIRKMVEEKLQVSIPRRYRLSIDWRKGVDGGDWGALKENAQLFFYDPTCG
jgi:hypothetical protein